MKNIRKDIPGDTVRIVQVEDCTADAELVIDALRADGIECSVRLVDTEADYRDALATFAPDIVLSDISLPGFNGYRAVEILRESSATIPFIFISGTLGEAAAIEALQRGASDYILKHSMARLATAVRRALHEAAEERAHAHAEDELIRAQRFESLALLAGGLSHDLRNLLQPLLLAADTLEGYRDDPHLARTGALVRGCGERGLEMVQSMLNFARGARRAEMVRLRDLLDALALLLRGTVPRAVRLEIDHGELDLEIEGNHTELQQCLLNLCLNALQAMPDGGHLHVVASELSLRADFFEPQEAVAPGRYLELVVSDTGSGMEPAVLANLFQPFFTTKEGGTGLGLISCKRIVANHHGVLRVDSTPGEGSHFRLYLPLRDADTIGAAEDLPHGTGQAVLVVVEEAGALSILSDTLDHYGYRVRASQSGAAALQSLQEDGLPHMVVMDADMNLLTGVRTLVALLERDYRGGVLLMAHRESPPDLEGLPPLPHLRVLDKPVETAVLLHALHEALQG